MLTRLRNRFKETPECPEEQPLFGISDHDSDDGDSDDVLLFGNNQTENMIELKTYPVTDSNKTAKLIDVDDMTEHKLVQTKEPSNKEQTMQTMQIMQIMKEFYDNLENKKMIKIYELLDEHQNHDFSEIINIELPTGESCLSISISKTGFIGVDFIKYIIKRGANTFNQISFFLNLKNLLIPENVEFREEGTGIFNFFFNNSTVKTEVIQPLITFQDYIDICRLLIINEKDIEHKNCKIICLLQILLLDRFEKIDQSYYDLIEDLFMNQLSRSIKCNILIVDNNVDKYKQIGGYASNLLMIPIEFVLQQKFNISNKDTQTANFMNSYNKELFLVVKQIIANNNDNPSVLILNCTFLSNDTIFDVIKFLISIGHDPTKTNASGNALHGITSRRVISDPNVFIRHPNVKKTISLLLNNGLDPTFHDIKRKSPLDYIDDEMIDYIFS